MLDVLQVTDIEHMQSNATWFPANLLASLCAQLEASRDEAVQSCHARLSACLLAHREHALWCSKQAEAAVGA